MIGNNGESEDKVLDETVAEEALDEDAMPDIGVETIVDLTGELKVDKLVAKVEKSDPDEAAHKREIRKRLEELEEQRNAKLDDTFNIKIEDEF
ncbi:MAG: hypothetical protein KJP08_09215 [Gammaproteobacteria bacterium]|nr:hypothetical protein [Gammaproteobacteria bacterium]